MATQQLRKRKPNQMPEGYDLQGKKVKNKASAAPAATTTVPESEAPEQVQQRSPDEQPKQGRSDGQSKQRSPEETQKSTRERELPFLKRNMVTTILFFYFLQIVSQVFFGRNMGKISIYSHFVSCLFAINFLVFGFHISQADCQKNKGLSRAVFVANLMIGLVYFIMIVFYRFYQCQKDPFFTGSCIASIYSTVIGQNADIVNLIGVAFPLMLTIYRLALEIFFYWRADKLRYVLILSGCTVVLCLCDKSRKQPVLGFGSVLLFFALGLYLVYGYVDAEGQRKRTPPDTGGSKQWVYDRAYRVSQLVYAFFVVDPLRSFLGAGRARVFLDLPQDTGVLHLAETVTFWECLAISVSLIAGIVPNESMFAINVLGVVLLGGRLKYHARFNIYRGLVWFAFIQLFLSSYLTSWHVNLLVAVAVEKAYAFYQETKTGTDSENSENEFEKQNHRLGFCAKMGTFLIFMANFVILLLLCLSIAYNSATSLFTISHDDFFVITMKLLTFFSISVVSFGFVPLCFDLMIDSNNHFRQLLSLKMRTCDIRHKRKQKDEEFHWSLSFTCAAVLFVGLSAINYEITAGTKLGNFHTTNAGLTAEMFTSKLSREIKNDEHLVAMQRNDGHSYTACSMRWGGDLTALDHALLAQMAYFAGENNKTELQGMKDYLKFVFPEGYGAELDVDWEGTNPVRKLHIDTDLFKKYYKVDFHDRKHTVIAIQGTDFSDKKDAMTDLRLWLASVLMDAAESVLPQFKLMMPRHRAGVQKVLHQINDLFTIDDPELDYHIPIVQYVHELINNKDPTRTRYRNGGHCASDDCWTMSVTGHSLGGGLTSIVGTAVGIPSVAFSGLGVLFSKGQRTIEVGGGEVLQPQLRNAVDLSTNFIPTSDLIPRMDSHMGTQVDTVCSGDGFYSCHGIDAQICDLIYRCGDGQNQKRFRSCGASHNLTFVPDKLEKYISG